MVSKAKKACFLTLIGCVMQASCTRQEQTDWSNLYRYFPVVKGHWVLYEVDSIAYIKIQDTVIHYRYLVRETVADTYKDLSGNDWQRIDHEVFRDSATGWVVSQASAQKISRNTAEKIHNNLRFIKLIFPFHKNTYWHGNSYINYADPYHCDFFGDWLYQYKELFVKKEVNGVLFDSVVVVQQVADSGIVCKNLALEMYAPDIGLIHKYTERLTTQKNNPDPFYLKAEDGYILSYSILDWKRE